MTKPLEREFLFYIDHQDELVAKYRGRFVVIKGHEVLGVYDDELEAISASAQDHEVGTFLVQKVEPGEENYTQHFHTRVSFS